jgi:hypothetical protein
MPDSYSQTEATDFISTPPKALSTSSIEDSNSDKDSDSAEEKSITTPKHITSPKPINMKTQQHQLCLDAYSVQVSPTLPSHISKGILLILHRDYK